MQQLKFVRCPVVECAVGALGVIKFYISINASHELTLGVILGPINFLPLHGGKEGLGHSIIMGTAGLRERLDNLVHAKQFPELCWMYIVGPGRCETSAAGARFCSDMPGERWT